MKIGIYGGTFNPPHIGHLRLAAYFDKKLKFDKLIIIPTYTPPHKNVRELASCEDRFHMCKLTFSEIPNAQISDMEIKRGGRSYTYDTLLELKKTYPNDELFLIIGSDMLLTFREWYKADEILKLCTLCAADRYDDESCLDDDSGVINKVIYAPLEPFEISSSEIIKMIKANQNISKYVTKDTENYIIERQLYHD